MAATIVAVAGVILSYENPVPKPEPKDAPQSTKTDLERMQGDWKVVYRKKWGYEYSDDKRKEALTAWEHHYSIQGNSIVVSDSMKILEGTCKLNSAANPKTIDVTIGKAYAPRKGIYMFDGDKLRVCWAGSNRPRPAKFSDKEEGGRDAIEIMQKYSKEASLDQPTEKTKREARLRLTGNLYELGGAMHRFHEEHGHFPRSAIFNKEGKATLSWRVALLPYLGFEDLYKEFKLYEPWDSTHNKALLARMPKVFASPEGSKKEDQHTYFQVFVGEDTVFELGKDIAYQDISDGTVSTILIIEARKSIPWTKPEDLPYSGDKPIPQLGGAIGDGLFSFVTADGSVHHARNGVDEDFQNKLRLFITANDEQIADWEAIGATDFTSLMDK
jgi:uncharacterized protein (TIGR03067 family)